MSTFMVSAHGNHADQKEFFLKGYQELLRRVEPERVICYNKPFTEMGGNIVYVDYELSSWKYQNDDFKGYAPSQYLPHVLGEELLPENSLVKIKQGFVLREEAILKGMGSAFGGDWKPAKPDDERYLGKPGEIKYTRSPGKRGGYDRATQIGDNGRAVKERHYTDHDSPGVHSNPHDHVINWNYPKPGIPNFEKPQINYPDGEAPEFKHFREVEYMSIIGTNSLEDNRFKTISDFKDCMIRGGEVELEYHDKVYGVFPNLKRTPNSEYQILLIQKFVENQTETEQWYDTADELLEFQIDGDRLRDIITKVDVNDRTI